MPLAASVIFTDVFLPLLYKWGPAGAGVMVVGIRLNALAGRSRR